MPATHLVVATQPGTIPAGAGASYPYVPIVIEAQDGGGVRDRSYGQVVAGVGTVTATAGAATFSTNQVGKIYDGSAIQVAGTWYVVSGFNGTTGCTLAGSPTFGASAFNISLQNGNPADLTYPYATFTLTGAPPGVVLSGSDKVAFLAGRAVAYGLAVSAPGTYTYTVTDSTGLTGTVSSSFVVTAAVDSFFNPDNRLRGLGAALPRTVPNRTRPSTGGRTIRRVGPSRTYTTIQSALDAAGANDRILLDLGVTFTEEVTAHVKAWTAGQEISIESDGWALAAGTRATQLHFMATGKPVWQPVSTNGAVIRFESGASPVRLLGLELRTNPAVLGTSALVILGFDDGDPLTNGELDGLWIEQCWLHHDDPTSGHTAARGVRWRAKNSGIIDSSIIGFQRTAQPDAQGILCDNTSGNLLLDNDDIEGESEGFMIGGVDFRSAALVPRDVTIRRCLFRKPIGQIGVWQPKNLIEFKAGHRILVEGCIGDGFWDANVSQWSAINCKSVNQTTSPTEEWEGASDVTIRHSFFRNIPDLLTLHGAPTTPVEVASRIVVHNVLCPNVNSTTWSNGTNGDGFLGHFAYHNDVVVDHVTFVSAPHATLLRGLLLATFSGPARYTTLSNILVQTDDGGATIIGGTGASPNMNGILALLDPAGVFDKNYIGGVDPAWVSYNQTNSPAGNIFVGRSGTDAPDPGFANYGIRATAGTADPLTICDALTITSGACFGTGTGASNIGVKDMAALKTAITGVLAGDPESGVVVPPPSTATQLAFTAQPAVFQHNTPLAPAPVVTLRDDTAATVPTASATITLSLVREAGTGELTGTLTLPTASGQASYSGLVVNAAVGIFRLKAEAPGFAPVYSQPFSLVEPMPTASSTPYAQGTDLVHGTGLLKR